MFSLGSAEALTISKKQARRVLRLAGARQCAKAALWAGTDFSHASRARQRGVMVSMNSLNILGKHKAGRPLRRVAADTSRRGDSGKIDHAALGAHVKTAAAVA